MKIQILSYSITNLNNKYDEAINQGVKRWDGVLTEALPPSPTPLKKKGGCKN